MFSQLSCTPCPSARSCSWPGILGTKLCEGGSLIWGGINSLRHFARLRIQAGTADAITPCGLVDRISLLGPFWAIHQYDDILSTFKTLGYEEGKTLFVFPYDWRQSNFETAKALQTFVDGAPQLRNTQFDIVSHSMGGIVTRIYLIRLGGSAKVRKAVYLATPFAGSMNALATLSNGWGSFANILAGGIDTIRRTIFSLPSFYELFPRYDRCCRIGSEASAQPINIFDFDIWKRYDWLPAEYLSGANANSVKENLARAAGLRDLLAQTIPDVQQVVAAGDAFATNLYLYAAKEDPKWENWRFSKSRGDGTVPVWSAANNFQSLAGTFPSFSEHATIFADDSVKALLLRELASNMPPPVASVEALFRLTTTAGTKSVKLIDLEVDPKIVQPDGTTNLSISIDFADPINRGTFMPVAQLLGPSKFTIPLTEVTTDQELASRRLSFSAQLKAPANEGAWQIEVYFQGQAKHSVFFETARP